MDVQTPATGSSNTNSTWRPLHAYFMAVVCLAIGFALGYLLRGSAPPQAGSMAAASVAAPAVTAPAATVAAPRAAPPANMPTLEDMKRMADKQTQPLLTELKKKPKDAALLNKTAMTYKAAHQFDKAAEYFKKSLDVDPKNVAVRADYASCLYYLGDPDAALVQLHKALTYDPKHPGVLYNIGMIEWKGKSNSNAALAAWEQMLRLNPDLPQKEQVQHMIEMVKQSKATVAEKQ